MERDIAALDDKRAENILKSSDAAVYEQMIQTFEEKIRSRLSTMLEMQSHMDHMEEQIESLKKKLSASQITAQTTRKNFEEQGEQIQVLRKRLNDEKALSKIMLERINQITTAQN